MNRLMTREIATIQAERGEQDLLGTFQNIVDSGEFRHDP